MWIFFQAFHCFLLDIFVPWYCCTYRDGNCNFVVLNNDNNDYSDSKLLWRILKCWNFRVQNNRLLWSIKYSGESLALVSSFLFHLLVDDKKCISRYNSEGHVFSDYKFEFFYQYITNMFKDATLFHFIAAVSKSPRRQWRQHTITSVWWHKGSCDHHFRLSGNF